MQMTPTHKFINLFGVGLPFVGLLAAIVLLWNTAIGPLQLALMIGLYVITALGITLGYHRMFTHRSLEASKPVRAVLAVMGSMAVQGSVIVWGSHPPQPPPLSPPHRRPPPPHRH